ncbi:hypothetical protein C3R30_21810, partial [Mycobacterium tuberculosis]
MPLAPLVCVAGAPPARSRCRICPRPPPAPSSPSPCAPSCSRSPARAARRCPSRWPVRRSAPRPLALLAVSAPRAPSGCGPAPR